MASSEFDIIRLYFNQFSKQRDWLVAGIGDDAAVINPPVGQQQLIAVDTLNAGIHFPIETSAADIGYKALAVNISDIAAMGGEPVWFTLSLSLPAANEEWLASFCDGMAALIDQYQLTLIGGDTTHGPLSVTIQIAGHVPTGQALLRSGSKPGDDIYVTGYLGNAAAGLLALRGELSVDAASQIEFINALNRPVPRVAMGRDLRVLANACIDISDGLAADLGHILEMSRVGAVINFDDIPVSKNLRKLQLTAQQLQQLVLCSGDNYELCFTASADKRARIEKLASRVGLPITRIGVITAESGFYHLDAGMKISVPLTGYDHFA